MGAKSFHKSFQINCVFKIDASKKNRGVFIIVRRLNFRMKGADQCRDYIRVEFGNKTKSEKICGVIGRNGPLKSFIDGTAKVKIEINIDTETPLEKDEEPVDFSIVFTGFSSEYRFVFAAIFCYNFLFPNQVAQRTVEAVFRQLFVLIPSLPQKPLTNFAFPIISGVTGSSIVQASAWTKVDAWSQKSSLSYSPQQFLCLP